MLYQYRQLGNIGSGALHDQDVQYVKILPLSQVTLHEPRILHFSAFHSHAHSNEVIPKFLS